MIFVKVNGCDLSAKPLHAVTSGTVGREVRFDFSPEWTDLVKTAVFKGSGEARDVALLASDTCTLPPDVLEEHGGDLLIGVYGRNAAGTVVMPTVWGRVEYIREGAELSEADPSEPAPDWTAQVQAAAASALEKAGAVEAAAARGDFDGAPGTDGVSPAVTVAAITGGHRVTITDAAHPDGQTFDVMDGQGGGGGGGQDGVSPGVTIEEITGGHRVTITDADHPNGQSFDVLDGADGQDGADGTNGTDGADGSDGADGVSPAVSITGITGGHRVTITDADHPQGQAFDVLDGEDGTDGTNGTDGVSPSVSVSPITGGHRITITDAAHPQGQTIDVMDGTNGTNGSNGSDGADGADGVSPSVTVSSITGGHRVTITDASHPNGQSIDVMDGTNGSSGTNGISPAVSVSGITGGHRVTVTDADHPSGQVFDVLDGATGATGATGPQGPGVPSGGSTGQVLKKTSSTDYDTEWGNVGDVTADMLGIVIDGNSTPVGASAGQYVIVKNSTISGVTDGLYKAALAIPANTAIDATYLTAVSNGGFNSLGGALSKYGKVLWDGNLSGAGSITVPDLDSYALIGIISGYGDMYMMIGNQTRGGTLYGTYRGTTVSQLAYRFGYSNNVLTVSDDDRGVTDGTNTTYSGNAICALIRVIGLIPKN